MIVKLIRATVRPGFRDAFLERQRGWNRVMARQRGFVSCFVATDPAEPTSVHIAVTMRCREDLDRFMAGDHDRVEAETGMRACYDALDVRVLEVVEALPGPGAGTPATRQPAAAGGVDRVEEGAPARATVGAADPRPPGVEERGRASAAVRGERRA